MSEPSRAQLPMAIPDALYRSRSQASMFGIKDPWDWQSPKQKRVRQLLHSMLFEYCMAFVIVGNVILIIVETDYFATEGHDREPLWITIPSNLVLLIFVIELALRLYSEQMTFFKEEWNIFDILIISADFISSSCALILGSSMPISVLRVCRVIKVARVSQLFNVFGELKLMVIGLIGAVRAMFWGTVLLFVALLVLSIIGVQILHPLNLEVEKTGVYGDCGRCGRAFETVLAATLTFSQQILMGPEYPTLPSLQGLDATKRDLAGMMQANPKLDLLDDATASIRKVEQQETEQLAQLLNIDLKLDSQGFKLPTSQNPAATTPTRVAENLLDSIVGEIRKGHAELSHKIQNMEKNLEMSISRSMPLSSRTAQSLWQVPVMCQHVSLAKKDRTTVV